MYYLATYFLKWEDETFWDSSLSFLVKQLDIHNKMHNKEENDKPKKLKSGDTETTVKMEGNKRITTERKKLSCM